MKTVTEKVYSRLAWHVAGTLSPDDQADYWRIYWHYKKYRAGRLAGRITMALILLAVLVFGSGSANASTALTIAIVGGMLAFAVGVYARAHRASAQCIRSTDPAKWQAISEEALPVCQACRPGDRKETVTITLP